MKKINWRKYNRATHRDLGYIFFAMTVIYSVSGIAINHLDDWNPNYIITVSEIRESPRTDSIAIDKAQIINILKKYDEAENYKKHYFPQPGVVKIFLRSSGTAYIDLETGEGSIERLKRRPVFNQFNYLHYNPGKWWVWFSDAFAVGLVLLAVSGLFILKGKNGITGRGAILTIIGIAIPIIFLVIFY
jgi:hypothetical protein